MKNKMKSTLKFKHEYLLDELKAIEKHAERAKVFADTFTFLTNEGRAELVKRINRFPKAVRSVRELLYP